MKSGDLARADWSALQNHLGSASAGGLPLQNWCAAIGLRLEQACLKQGTETCSESAPNLPLEFSIRLSIVGYVHFNNVRKELYYANNRNGPHLITSCKLWCSK